MRDRWQRIWLLTSAGNVRRARAGNALFREPVLDLLVRTDQLVWPPDYDTVRSALDRTDQLGDRHCVS